MSSATSTSLPAADKQRLAVKRQRARSVAIAVSLALLVSLFYAATLVRLGSSGVMRVTAEASHK